MSSTLFQQRHSRALRLWHWSTAAITALLLFTIMVSKTFLNGQHAGFVIDHAAARSGTVLSNGQVNNIVWTLRATIWKWHIKFGYILSFLLLFRFILECFQPGDQKFIYKIKNAFRLLHKKENIKTTRHYLAVKSIYVLFYLLITVMVLSGLWLSFHKDPFPALDELYHRIHSLHETCFNFLLLFLFIHLVGVIRAESGKHKNIVSGMIHGESST